jgi:hypothetical protein
MDIARNKRKVWSWQATGAVLTFAGGLAAAVIGCGLTASSWVWAANAHPWLRELGTVLLILTIPLLILAGYCMDWEDRNRHKTRRQTARAAGRILD